MKQLTAISLAFLVFAVAAKDVLMWASFKANQDYISKHLCINQDQPEKLCSGKCVLTKKIVETKDKTPHQAPVPQPDEQKQVLSFHEILPLQINAFISREIKPFFTSQSFLAQACAVDIFQPPRV
ncbi:MAG: hypothetical protein IT258_03870 [Saprospiraceae bacterium]|nr:hypothetical protein [Saprospiraceae bacterium]